MATTTHMSLLILLTLVALTPSTSAATLLNLLLPVFGFPQGIIPEPLESYYIAPAGLLSFHFTVYFSNPCYVKFEYLNFFDTVFTGTISPGKISGMTGHRDRFPDGIWRDMYGVDVVDDTLVFTFSNATVTFNKTDFEEIKTCQSAPFDAPPFDAPYASHSKKLISQLPLAAE